MDYYCTYFDINYLSRGMLLLASLKQHSRADFRLFVLCLDQQTKIILEQANDAHIEALSIVELENYFSELIRVKNNRSRIEYIFTLSPFLPLYILEKNEPIDCINYLDADLLFYNNTQLLFDEFGAGSIMIIPHNFSEKNRGMEVYGIYNVGYVGFKRDANGLACLTNWKAKCYEWCKDIVEPERFADQKYLDKWPHEFDNVIVAKHPGLNLAPYNVEKFRLNKIEETIMVDDQPLIFYHFHGIKKLIGCVYMLNFLDEAPNYDQVLISEMYKSYIDDLTAYQTAHNIQPTNIRSGNQSFLQLFKLFIMQQIIINCRNGLISAHVKKLKIKFF